MAAMLMAVGLVVAIIGAGMSVSAATASCTGSRQCGGGVVQAVDSCRPVYTSAAHRGLRPVSAQANLAGSAAIAVTGLRRTIAGVIANDFYHWQAAAATQRWSWALAAGGDFYSYSPRRL